MKTHISHSFDFGAGGNARDIQISGWSGAEPEHTWSAGERGTVAIDNVVAPHGYFLELDWQPFVVHPYRPDQAVTIRVDDHRISPYRLSRREITAFYSPPPVPGGRKIFITFDYPDAARFADYVQTHDPREVAIAFRRLRIIPLDEPSPMRLSNAEALKARTEAEQITVPYRGGAVRIIAGDLLSQFEMLAGNCDLGLSVRWLNFDQLSLLRFAGATQEAAMRGLETGFQGIGEHLSTEIADNPINEWMVRDAFGLRFHTHQSSDDMTEQEVLRRQRQHIGFLRRKLLEDLQNSEKIFVYADHIRPGTFEAALALFLSLNRRRQNKMLWVTQNMGEMSPGRVDELLPGFARGSLDIFAEPLIAGHIAVGGWINVLLNAAIVLNGWNKSLVP